MEAAPRRSPRRAILASIDNNTVTALESDTFENTNITPQILADEYIIEHRGRRKKPITWSPVDYNKKDLLGPPRDKTPERTRQRPDINSKLRKRLTMSPIREPTPLGDTIAKKLKILSNYSNEGKRSEIK